jgi:hypothetical protein
MLASSYVPQTDRHDSLKFLQHYQTEHVLVIVEVLIKVKRFEQVFHHYRWAAVTLIRIHSKTHQSWKTYSHDTRSTNMLGH